MIEIEFESEFSSEHAMSSERYSENGNLTLKSGAAVTAVAAVVRSGLDRSSSGSSHGSGHSGSANNSSGYVSEETVAERKLIKEHCQVEIEESDQDQSEAAVVTVTGGLQLGPRAVSSQVRVFSQNNLISLH